MFINYQWEKRSNSFAFLSFCYFCDRVKMKVGLFAVSLIAYTNAFCFHQYGGIGEVHRDCPDSAGKYNSTQWVIWFDYLIVSDYDACYARCNCWSDLPDNGGTITHEVDARCMSDGCWCNYDNYACPYGTLKTNPWCCTKTEGWQCEDFECDTDGHCTHIPTE